MTILSNAIESAKQDFRRDWENGNINLDEPHDSIHELADGAVPVYHSQLLEAAAEDNEIALREPEIGPAFDGAPTPVNIIAANFYELVSEALFEYAREIEEEVRDKLDNVSDLTDEEIVNEIKEFSKHEGWAEYVSALEDEQATRTPEEE